MKKEERREVMNIGGLAIRPFPEAFMQVHGMMDGEQEGFPVVFGEWKLWEGRHQVVQTWQVWYCEVLWDSMSGE